MPRYLKFNLIVSKCTMAMYKIDENASKTTKILYKLLRVVINIVLFSGLILTAINVVLINFEKGKLEIDKMAVEIMTIIIFFSAIFRTNYFYFCENKLERVVKTINKFKHKTTTGFEEKNLNNCVKITKMFVVLWSFSVFFTGQFMALLPLFEIHKVGRVLPLPLWYPFDSKRTPYYQIIYLTQIVTQHFMVFSYGNSDMFFSCTTIFITEQFTLLGWTLKNLIHTVLLKHGIDKKSIETNKLS
nr:putative odorant receptor 85e [Onthophagus taurus]